jgi:hypothetical protein
LEDSGKKNLDVETSGKDSNDPGKKCKRRALARPDDEQIEVKKKTLKINL